MQFLLILLNKTPIESVAERLNIKAIVSIYSAGQDCSPLLVI